MSAGQKLGRCTTSLFLLIVTSVMVGSPPAAAIKGGDTVTVPPVWAVLVRSNYGPWEEPICSGAVIASDWIITAAHCVEVKDANGNSLDQSKSVSQVRILVGANEAGGTSPGAEYGVAQIVRDHAHDLALVRVNGPFASWVRPLAVSTSGLSTPAGTELRLYGYGNSSVDESLPTWNEQKGSASGSGVLRLTPAGAYKVASSCSWANSVCLVRQGASTMLWGDSGGPWVYQFPDGSLTLVGVNSAFIGTNGSLTNVRATDVRALRAWIQSTAGLITPRVGAIYRDPATGETWFVGTDSVRRPIPTGGDYNCFVSKGVQVINLPRFTIEEVPYRGDQKATCAPDDRDSDGVPDSSDACPDQPGPASNNGCPLPPTGTVSIANTGGIGVRLRNSPNFNDIKSSGPPEGATVSVSCYANGEAVGGNTLWYLIGWNGLTGYIPAYYTNAPSRPSWLTAACTNVPPAPVGQLVNGGFESANTGWIITYNPGGVVNRSVWTFPGRARTGSGFLEANTSVSGGSVGQDTNIVPVAGQYYAVRLWMRDPTGSATPFSATIALWALGGAQENSTTEVQIGSEWTPVDVVLRVNNGGHTRIRVEFYMNTVNRNINFDDVSLNITGGDPNINTWNPVGSLDEVSSPAPGQVRVRGWSMDPNAYMSPTAVHVYIGGQAGQPGAVGYNLGAANASRPDVAAYAPYAGAAHGFDQVLTTSATGTVTVCGYGINIGQGSNVMLSNSCKTVTVMAPRPPNDSFNSPCALTTPNGSATLSTTNATHEAGEPNHDGRNGVASVWCRLTVPKYQQVRISTAGSSFDTVLALYTGTSVQTLTAVASNDDANGTLQSSIDVWLEPGVVYSLAVDGYAGATGTALVRVSYLGSPDDFATPCVMNALVPHVEFPTQGFTAEPARDPDGPIAMMMADRTAWCAYTAPADGVVTFSTAGSNFDTVLIDYSGSPAGSWTYNDDWSYPSDLTSRLTRQVDVGEVILLAIAGTGHSSGRLSLTATWSPRPIVGLAASRLLETRPGQLTVDGQFQGIGRIAGRGTVQLTVGGRGGIPANAAAVLLNITAVRPASAGYVTVYPCGMPLPTASNVNYQAGQVVANAALVGVGIGGAVCVYTSATSDIIVDVSGFVPVNGSPVPVVPARLFESRSGSSTSDGQYQGVGRVAGGTTVAFTVAGRALVPSDAEAVMINLTSIRPDSAGFLTVFPCGEPRPTASNVNYQPGQITPNAALARIGVDGKICVYTQATTDLIVDVTAYVPAGGWPATITPARLLETRSGQPTTDGAFQGIGRVLGGSTIELDVSGRGGVEWNATSAMINVTAIRPEAGGYIVVYACNASRPTTSNLNFQPGQVVANAALTPLSPDGKICIYTTSTTDIVIDVSSYTIAS